MDNTKTIIVTYDFTERGHNAMLHALHFGASMQARIIMLHLVSSEKQKISATSRLNEKRKLYEYEYEIDTAVINENLATGVKKYAEYVKAILVIMGAKNPSQGFEKIFGGQTLKIIMGGAVPFLVVREKPHYETLKKIVVPINYSAHNKEKLRWVRILSKFFKFRVELFVQNEQNIDERTDTKANFLFAKRYLDRYGIARKTTLAPKGISFREALINHTYKTQADFMMIMISDHLSVLDFLIGADEEYVIANTYKIPVMCVNPRIDLVRFSDFF
ncbi:MAG: universal stress protein [Flavobacteriaceae bacterium]|nr:universal stress protein [Flavobacteriaceae bacterium]